MPIGAVRTEPLSPAFKNGSYHHLALLNTWAITFLWTSSKSWCQLWTVPLDFDGSQLAWGAPADTAPTAGAGLSRPWAEELGALPSGTGEH
jgi:hypothetical protein